MATKRNPVGYEIVERYDNPHGVQASIVLWAGDFNRQLIVDRPTNRPAERRAIASIIPADGVYIYKTHAGAKGGWRNGWAKDYESALAAVHAWIQRRFDRVDIGRGVGRS